MDDFKYEQESVLSRNDYLLCGLLFLLGFNFRNMFYIIFLVFAFLSFLVYRKSCLKPNILIRLLILFSFSFAYLYAYTKMYGTNIVKIIVITSFPIMYYLGYSTLVDGRKWKAPIISIVLGLTLHGVLNFLYNFRMLSGNTARSTIDFWTHSEWIITGQISLFIMIAGLSYYIFACVSFKEKPLVKTSLVILWSIGMLYNVLTATRTVVYAAVLTSMICSIVHLVRFNKEQKGVARYLVTVLFAILVIFFAYSIDFMGIKSWFMSTPLYTRTQVIGVLSQSDDILSRQGQAIAAFSQLLSHPNGGYTMAFSRNLKFIHNTWLNIAYFAGLVPCILFFLFSLGAFRDMTIIVKNGINNQDVVFIVGVYIAVFVYLVLEPVCEAVPSMITLFCYICGYVRNRSEVVGI